jgi:hypothetical protein
LVEAERGGEEDDEDAGNAAHILGVAPRAAAPSQGVAGWPQRQSASGALCPAGSSGFSLCSPLRQLATSS